LSCDRRLFSVLARNQSSGIQACNHRHPTLAASVAGRLNSNPEEPEPPFTKRLTSLKSSDDGQAISKRGNRQLRTLLIVGATSIIKLAKRGLKVPLWIRTMLQRRPATVVSVALANKIARTIWALLVRAASIRRRPNAEILILRALRQKKKAAEEARCKSG
jgi:hypothetical protein